MTPEECYERWYKRIVDSAIDSVQASVKEMIEQGKSENTYAWIHPKKGRIYTRCGGSLDENYTAGTRLWGYHQDVTENMQAAEIALQEAKRANAAKTTFLSRMSHDIRTPLMVLSGCWRLVSVIRTMWSCCAKTVRRKRLQRTICCR